MASFLEVDPDSKGHIMKNLLIPGADLQNEDHSTPEKTVRPEPGFCIKVKSVDGRKIFINICKSSDLPSPKHLSEDELIAILESDNPSDYKVPLSLGDAHFEVDKSGQNCVAYDVIINKDFFDKIENNILFKTFVITVAMEGLETKHNMELQKNDYVVLKNKLYLGTMQTVQIKSRMKPLVTEYTSEPTKSQKSTLHSPLKPKFELRWKRKDRLLTAKIEIPNTKLGSDILLDLGEDRIVLNTKAELKYFLDIFIPLQINPDEAKAEFDRKSQVLSINAAVVSDL